jgi:hypothetical protein
MGEQPMGKVLPFPHDIQTCDDACERAKQTLKRLHSAFDEVILLAYAVDDVRTCAEREQSDFWDALERHGLMDELTKRDVLYLLDIYDHREEVCASSVSGWPSSGSLIRKIAVASRRRRPNNLFISYRSDPEIEKLLFWHFAGHGFFRDGIFLDTQ